jgi:hypothetical protein
MAGAEARLQRARLAARLVTTTVTLTLASFPCPCDRALAAAAPAVAQTEPLRLAGFTAAADRQQLLEGGAAAWAGAVEQPVLLNRTPPLYEGDPADDGLRPTALVSVARLQHGTVVRLRWTDATDSRPDAPDRVPDGGDAHVYKQHSQDIERFADAACVMVPIRSSTSNPWPSLIMGEAGAPVDLFFWHLVRGFRRLQAAGRGSTQDTGQAFAGSARRTSEGWEVVFELPADGGTLPMAFAVWDGQREHRDGLKWFSPWYEVAP